MVKFDFNRDPDSCIKTHGKILERSFHLYHELLQTRDVINRCEAALISQKCNDYYFNNLSDEDDVLELKNRYHDKETAIRGEIEYLGDLKLIMFNSLNEDLMNLKLEVSDLKAKLAQEDIPVANIQPLRPERPKMPLNFSAAAAAAEDSEERSVKTPILARIRTALGNKRRK